jgi:glycosyltransferase involved in cell wall biosynthesis
VVGDGIERGRLEKAAGNPRLLWLGRRPYREVPAILRGARAALCPIEDPDGRSATGVAPLKLYEAMACGVPVIATDLPFQREIVIGEDAGYIVPPGDAPALAQAVASVAINPEEARRKGARGAAYAVAQASWAARAAEVSSRMSEHVGGTTGT